MEVISERKEIDGQILGGEKRIFYHIDADNDDHAAVAAEKGFNTNFLDLKKVSLERVTRAGDVTGNKVVFSLREHIGVELKVERGQVDHDCSCSDYDPDSPCSHIYWAWDQILRLYADDQRQSTLEVDMGNSARAVEVANSIVDPAEIVRIFRRTTLEALVTRRTDPRIANLAHDSCKNNVYRTFFQALEPLPRPFGPDPSSLGANRAIKQLGEMIANFTARDNGFEKRVEEVLGRSRQPELEFEKVQREAERCFLSSDEWALGGTQIPLNDYMVRHPPLALRQLEHCVSHVWLVWQQAEPLAVGAAVRACLYMVRGILMRPNLRALSLTQYEGGGQDNFWMGVDEFFRDPSVTLSSNDRECLTASKAFIEAHGTHEDATLADLIARWVRSGARRRMV